MAINPTEKAVTSAEQAFSKDMTAELTKAVQSRDVQAKADEETTQSSRTPPKPVLSIFEKALSQAVDKAEKKYKGIKIASKMTYKMRGESWIASVAATVTFKREKRGGASHKVGPGETVWQIAESYYGSGLFWPVIEKANPGMVSKGNFIVCAMGLKIPQIEVVSVPALVPDMCNCRAPTAANKPAKTVLYPTMEYDLSKTAEVTTVVQMPGMKLFITTGLKGEIKAQKAGALPASFNLKSYDAEIKAEGRTFANSIKLDSAGLKEFTMSSAISGTTWKAQYSIGKDGSFKASVSPKPVSFVLKDITFEGSVALEITGRLVPDMPKTAPQPVPVPVGERVTQWFEENGKTALGVGLLVGAGILVVATIGEDIITLGAGIVDDPASFAAASAMASGGLRLIAR